MGKDRGREKGEFLNSIPFDKASLRNLINNLQARNFQGRILKHEEWNLEDNTVSLTPSLQNSIPSELVITGG